MTSPFSQQLIGVRSLAGLCNPIHDAGISPNSMNRFLHRSVQEVLFVN